LCSSQDASDRTTTGPAHHFKNNPFAKEICRVFARFDLATEECLEVTSTLMRPSDLSYSAMDSGKIQTPLGWKSGLALEENKRRCTLTKFCREWGDTQERKAAKGA
jgi:hypothetical protein